MSRLLPDFDSTATGYIFLDKLTAPFWRWMSRRAERLFEERVGITDWFEGLGYTPLDNPGFEDADGLEPWEAVEYWPVVEVSGADFDSDTEIDLNVYPPTFIDRPPDGRP